MHTADCGKIGCLWAIRRSCHRDWPSQSRAAPASEFYSLLPSRRQDGISRSFTHTYPTQGQPPCMAPVTISLVLSPRQCAEHQCKQVSSAASV